MGLKSVSWVRRYQGQCRALRSLGHQRYRLRSYKKDLPLCSGYTLSIPGIHFAEQYAWHPSLSPFTFLPSGALVPGQVARTSHCTRLWPFSLYVRPAPPSPPCPLHPLSLRRTLCRQVARMSQARTWPLSSAPSGWLAPRCGRPPLPQSPQEPLPWAVTPNAAGGAALVGPAAPRPGFSAPAVRPALAS